MNSDLVPGGVKRDESAAAGVNTRLDEPAIKATGLLPTHDANSIELHLSLAAILATQLHF